MRGQVQRQDRQERPEAQPHDELGQEERQDRSASGSASSEAGRRVGHRAMGVGRGSDRRGTAPNGGGRPDATTTGRRLTLLGPSVRGMGRLGRGPRQSTGPAVCSPDVPARRSSPSRSSSFLVLLPTRRSYLSGWRGRGPVGLPRVVLAMAARLAELPSPGSLPRADPRPRLPHAIRDRPARVRPPARSGRARTAGPSTTGARRPGCHAARPAWQLTAGSAPARAAWGLDPAVDFPQSRLVRGLPVAGPRGSSGRGVTGWRPSRSPSWPASSKVISTAPAERSATFVGADPDDLAFVPERDHRDRDRAPLAPLRARATSC